MTWDPNQGPTGEPIPPQGTQYEYNPYATPAAVATPLPLGDALGQLPNQYLKVVTKPGQNTFAEEAGKAEWGIVWTQLVIYAIITAILGAFASATTTALLTGLTGNTSTTPASPVTTIIFSLIGTFAGFFIIQGIFYGLAKAFKGQGTFVQQTYTFLLFQVPLGILSAILAFIPIAGGFIGLAIAIYEIVLGIFAIMGVHKLSGGKASAVVLIPYAVLVALAICLVIVLAAALAAATRQ